MPAHIFKTTDVCVERASIGWWWRDEKVRQHVTCTWSMSSSLPLLSYGMNGLILANDICVLSDNGLVRFHRCLVRFHLATMFTLGVYVFYANLEERAVLSLI